MAVVTRNERRQRRKAFAPARALPTGTALAGPRHVHDALPTIVTSHASELASARPILRALAQSVKTSPLKPEEGALASAQPAVTPQKPFVAASPIPTQAGPDGLRFDFNDGCRLTLPEGDWHVRLRDTGTGNILFETQIAQGTVASSKKYFVPFEIEVQSHGRTILQHRQSLRERDVLIQFPVGTLGDLIGWFPYAVRFQRQHGCALTCSMSGLLIPLFAPCYPDIAFITPEQVDPAHFYASYRIGLFFDDEARIHQPCDFRLVGLHRTAAYILGVDPSEVPPAIHLPDASRPIAERYVCVASQSSTQCKYWNNPNGWREIVAFLKGNGYRVICIDQKPTHGHGMVWNHIPYGAEDQTGAQPLIDRARWLKHADFFVGLSSGLSWLAWAVGTPVVMISGFTHPSNEFATPHRVINYHTCNSCWNDVRVRFDHQDFLWCPRHAGTDRQFECTRLITSDQVKATIRAVPGFAVGLA